MLRIISPALESICQHARREYPEECCGVLIGRRAEAGAVEVLRALEVSNAAGVLRRRRYRIDSDVVHAAAADAERSGLELLGFYHSHPDRPARPSRLDQENAWPWFTYLIVRTGRGGTAEVRGWRLADDRSRFEEDDVRVVEPGAATIRVPSPLQAFAEGRGEVSVTAGTVGEALAELARRYPQLRRHLFGEDGRLRSFVNVFLNDEDVRHSGGEQAAVRPGDTLVIVPSIAGGAGEEPRLSPPELRRYARHIVLPEVGREGQERLKQARVLIVGAGGLGSPLGLYLAAAGVGTLGVVDFDVVDESNLQRQVLFGTRDVGRLKVEAAAERLRDTNPHVRIELHPLRISSDNALDIIRRYDVVVDGTDNFPSRYLLSDACVLLGKPYVYGSIYRFEGQVSVFDAASGPCYRCLFREPPPPGLVPNCAEGGVLGVLPGIVGSLQAVETIKLILAVGEPLTSRLVVFDALSMRWRELRLRKDPECPACGDSPSITELIDYERFCGLEADEMDSDESAIPEVGAAELAEWLRGDSPPLLLDVREPFEWEIANLGPHGAHLIPMRQLAERLDELDPERELVVYCRSGNRSATALEQLREAGFERVWNLRGGILAWADQVDPEIRKY